MFDFNRLGITPTYTDEFETPASDEHIAKLEQYCQHPLPERFKVILKNYNGGSPAANNFNAMDEDGPLGGCTITNFYFLNDETFFPNNIWWLIEHEGRNIGMHNLPFADDGHQQIYYMKWVNDMPQVWYYQYLDLDEPRQFKIANSFDEFLDSLYSW